MNPLAITVTIPPDLLEAAASVRRDLLADQAASQAVQAKADAGQAALQGFQEERRRLSSQEHEASRMRAAVERAGELDSMIGEAQREAALLQIEADGAAVPLAASCRRAFTRLGEIYLSDFEQRHQTLVELLLPFFQSRRQAESGVSRLDFFWLNGPVIRNRSNVRISPDENFVAVQLRELDRVHSGETSIPWPGVAPFPKSFSADGPTETATLSTAETADALQPV